MRSAVDEQIRAVVVALKPSEDLSADAAGALRDAAPYCLSTWADERHPYQVELVAMVEKALAGIEASLQKDVAEANEAVASRGQVEIDLEAAASAAAQEVARNAAELAKLEAEVVVADIKNRKAVKVLKEKAKEQKVGDKTVIALEKEQVSLKAIVETYVGHMKVAAASKKETSMLKTALGPFINDSALMHSLDLALAKEPAARSDFDATVLQNLDNAIAGKLGEVSAALEEAAPAKDARAAVLEEAKATYEAAKARLDGARDGVRKAEALKTKCKKTLEAALKAEKGFDAETAKVLATSEECKTRLIDFQTGPLATFAALKSLAAPSPAVPGAEAEEPVATMPDALPSDDAESRAVVTPA